MLPTWPHSFHPEAFTVLPFVVSQLSLQSSKAVDPRSPFVFIFFCFFVTTVALTPWTALSPRKPFSLTGLGNFLGVLLRGGYSPFPTVTMAQSLSPCPSVSLLRDLLHGRPAPGRLPVDTWEHLHLCHQPLVPEAFLVPHLLLVGDQLDCSDVTFNSSKTELI